MKNILITRTKEQGKGLAQFFKSAGYEVFVEGLFVVEKFQVMKVSKPVSAVIITSDNACFALDKAGLKKDIKVFTVGKKTAQKLQNNGFKNVVISPRNSAESLLELVKKEIGLVLYFRGLVVNFDFSKIVQNVEDVVVYSTHEVESFSYDLTCFIQKNFFDEVLIFSQNSAVLFFKLAKKHNLLEYFSLSTILCFSDKILNSVQKMGFRNSKVFSENAILKKFYD